MPSCLGAVSCGLRLVGYNRSGHIGRDPSARLTCLFVRHPVFMPTQSIMASASTSAEAAAVEDSLQRRGLGDGLGLIDGPRWRRGFFSDLIEHGHACRRMPGVSWTETGVGMEVEGEGEGKIP